MAFQILNRTVWTNNKAFKSWIRADPNCKQSGSIVTMKHLLCKSEYYLKLLWLRLGDVLTHHLNMYLSHLVPRVELGQTNIIFNIPHLSILLHIHNKTTCITFNTGNQERHHLQTEESAPQVQQVTATEQLSAPLVSTIRRLCPYLQDIGVVKYSKATETFLQLQEINLAWCHHDKNTPIPC
jgi:hypothetical protein